MSSPGSAGDDPPSERSALGTLGDWLVSDKAVTVVVILFGVLVLVAAVILQARLYIDPPRSADFETTEAYRLALENHRNTLRAMSVIGILMIDFAVIFLVTLSVLVSLKRTDIGDAIRRNLLIFALVVFAIWWIVLLSQTVVPIPFPTSFP